jgi:NAD-dependent dihydropyrimidine dehydrogenase PreA subunit
MAIRNIIKIDEEKCDGCGHCVEACAEGAIRIIDGKAKLVGEILCDGFGACLGSCPMDALTIEKREAEGYDEEAVEKHLAAEKQAEAKPEPEPLPCGCPGSALKTLMPQMPDHNQPRLAVLPGKAQGYFQNRPALEDYCPEDGSALLQRHRPGRYDGSSSGFAGYPIGSAHHNDQRRDSSRYCHSTGFPSEETGLI